MRFAIFVLFSEFRLSHLGNIYDKIRPGYRARMKRPKVVRKAEGLHFPPKPKLLYHGCFNFKYNLLAWPHVTSILGDQILLHWSYRYRDVIDLGSKRLNNLPIRQESCCSINNETLKWPTLASGSYQIDPNNDFVERCVEFQSRSIVYCPIVWFYFGLYQ